MRAFLAILFFCWLITLFLPWWGIIIPCLIFGAWLIEHAGKAFLIGFVGGGLAWFLQALYIDIANESILSTRIAEMMEVGSHWMILLATFLIAAILSGFATLTGYLFKAVLKSDKEITTT